MSLFDELQEAATEDENYDIDVTETDNSQPAASGTESTRVHQQKRKDGDVLPVTAADLHLSSRTPLARYMAQLSGNAAPDEELPIHDDTNDMQDTNDIPRTTTPPTSSSPESTASRFHLVLRIAFEVISPLLSLIILPRTTLLSQSNRWIAHTCFRTGELMQLDATTGTAAGLVAHITSTRLHLTRQLQQLRNFYFLALILSSIPSIAFFWQVGLTLFVEFYQFSLQIVVGSSSSEIRSKTFEFHWSNALWNLFLLSSVPDFIIAFISLRRVISLHSFCSLFLDTVYSFSRMEQLSKKLILVLMEREIVRRGYQLSAYLPPIERLEASGNSNLVNGMDRSAQIRQVLHESIQGELDLMQRVQQQFQQISLRIETSFTLPTIVDAAENSRRPPEKHHPDQLPSILQLKTTRTDWQRQRLVLLQQTFRILQAIQYYTPDRLETLKGMAEEGLFQLCGSSSRGNATKQQPFIQMLCEAFFQINLKLLHDLDEMQSFLPPIDSASLTLPFEVEISAALPSEGSRPAKPQYQAHESLSQWDPSRRALQQQLQDLQHVFHSAQCRLQLALERQVETARQQQQTAAGTHAAELPNSASDKNKAVHSTWLSFLQSIELPRFESTQVTSSSSTQLAPPLPTTWTGDLSESYTSDVGYLRQLLSRMSKSCVEIDSHIRRINTAQGVDVESEQHNKKAKPISDLLMLAQSNSTSDTSDSSASAADAAVSPADLLSALAAMRRKPPDGMGALFEGAGVFEEREFKVRRNQPRPATNSNTNTSAAAPAQPAFSIFSMLSELKSVLQQRKPAYQYHTFSHGEEEAAAAVHQANSSEQLSSRQYDDE